MTLSPDDPSPDPSLADPSSDDSVVVVASQSVTYRWDGPPPQILEQYERIVPGAAEETFREWRIGLVHQRHEEKANMDVARTNRKRAAPYRLATLVIIIAGGLIAVVLGPTRNGLVLGVRRSP